MQNELIYHLLDLSFNKETYKFDSKDELELTKIIFENGLVGLLFETIDKSSFKTPKYHQMLLQAFGAFVSKDIQQQAIIKDLKSLFNAHKIKHVFLKGSHLKELYPQSYMRGMGDIDVVVPLDMFDVAKKVLIKHNYKFKSATSHHHVYETADGNFIELHQSITSSNEYENEALLKNVWDHVYQVSGYTYKLEPAFEYVYLLTHLIRHIRTSGVGIRSLLDMKVYFEYYESIMDLNKLNEYLVTYNLKDFNDKIVRLNQIFTNQIKPQEQDYHVIDYIMNSGIHGSGTKHDMYLTKRTHEQTRLKKSKIGFFFSEVFPSRDRIKETYPYLKKHPWLLPWAWTVRIFKQLFKVKNTKKRLKSITNDEEVDSVKGVYDYLGI